MASPFTGLRQLSSPTTSASGPVKVAATDHTQTNPAFPKTVSVFTGEGASGNQARVYWEGPLSGAEMQRRASTWPGTSCFVESPRVPGAPYPVHCFNQVAEIRLCGHGLLAAGYLIGRKLGCTKLALRTVDGWEIPILVTATGAQSRWPLLNWVSTPLPEWAASAFSTPPRQAATAGDEAGYLILQWDEQNPLADLQVDIQHIARQTRRAVIATQRDSKSRFDFLLRYFAPQYGQPEDAVTGSAVRVLAGYWREQLSRPDFRARQCSAGGGIVSGRLVGDAVFIGGSVTLLRTL